MWPYFLVYLSSLLVDCVPVFAPPAWTLMLFLMLKFSLNPWLVVIFGTFGTVSGRLIFSGLIIPWVGKKTLGAEKESDLIFLGEKLSSLGSATFFFVFLYSLLPLSTTALFTATGLANVKKRLIIPPFFLGNLIGDGLILLSGKAAAGGLGDFYRGALEPKSLLLMTLGLSVLLLFLFIDWHEAIMAKKLKLSWKFWK